MSTRLATALRTNRRTARPASVAAALIALCGAACGLLTIAIGTATAQPTSAPTTTPKAATKEAPQQPTKLPTKEDLNKLDRKNPVPADGRRRQPHSKFAIDTNFKIFAQIEDFKPVASETENRGEYDAWTQVVMQAKQFSAAELEAHAATDLAVIDFQKQFRSAYRCELFRFDGKLVCIRKLEAPKFFTDNPQSNIKEMYEARFVPLDESPLTPVSIVFLELPEAFAAVRQKAPKEWLDVNNWVTAAGYFFKVMSVPGDGEKTISMPVFVGKSITPLPSQPVPPGYDPTVIDPNLRLYSFIRDDAAMIRTTTELTWPEVAAENRIIMHAARFSAEELEKHARDNVKFADLFEDIRKDYRLKNVKLEGRLISLRRWDLNPELRAAGINNVFEGWLVPANEPRGNPVCIVFTEPLEGVEPNGRVNVWVSFAGYSFKLMRYESAETFENDPTRFKVKRAPLLIGKGPIRRPDPDAPTSLTWGVFLQTAIIVGALMIVAGGGLAWWYRRGDRKAKEAIETARNRNPFDPASHPNNNPNNTQPVA